VNTESYLSRLDPKVKDLIFDILNCIEKYQDRFYGNDLISILNTVDYLSKLDPKEKDLIFDILNCIEKYQDRFCGNDLIIILNTVGVMAQAFYIKTIDNHHITNQDSKVGQRGNQS
jgi:DNA replication initiation complex subunit (GINS family)